ncbi:unnamed protein product [Caenorhabditis nigoni]
MDQLSDPKLFRKQLRRTIARVCWQGTKTNIFILFSFPQTSRLWLQDTVDKSSLPRTSIGHLHVPINFYVGQDQSTFGYFPDSHPLPPGASLLRETFGTESGRRTLNEVVNIIQGHGSASGQSSSWINIGTRVPA